MSIRKYWLAVGVTALVLAGIAFTETTVPTIGKTFLPTPVAPQTVEQMTIPGAWTPEMLLQRAT